MMNELYTSFDNTNGGLVEDLSTGILIPAWLAQEQQRKAKTTMAVDLFAGCGGFSCGAMQAGMNVAAMVEWNPEAVLTYCCNLCRYGEMQFHFLSPSDEERMEKAIQNEWKRKKRDEFQAEFSFAGSGWIQSQPKIPGCKHVIVGDIRLLKGEDLMRWIGVQRGELGCMFGSPPCQGFSKANTSRHSSDPRNDLCFEFARLVVEVMPKTIALENVPDFSTSPQAARFVRILEDGGFEGVEAFERLLERRPYSIPATKRKTKTRNKKAMVDVE
jgi:DNA (cytosine-5)-methyltransferase 1